MSHIIPMTTCEEKYLWRPLLAVALFLTLCQLLLTEAYMKNVRIEEIPFGLTPHERDQSRMVKKGSEGIHAISQLETRRNFFHLFNVPYIFCFFAAKGKWPFIPPFMQMRVDAAAKGFFNRNDSSIRQFCQKWIDIKECFRPIFGIGTTPVPVVVEDLARSTACTCANLVAESPVVYFDRDHIGNASSDIILNTIEFLESFLPAPTKKTKRKNNRVRGRLDTIDID